MSRNTKRREQIPVNIYGRKPSTLVVAKTGARITNYDSRRKARKVRAKECEQMGLQTYETIIAPNGAQLPYPERKKDARKQESSVQT